MRAALARLFRWEKRYERGLLDAGGALSYKIKDRVQRLQNITARRTSPPHDEFIERVYAIRRRFSPRHMRRRQIGCIRINFGMFGMLPIGADEQIATI